jgi:hypothetical protein
MLGNISYRNAIAFAIILGSVSPSQGETNADMSVAMLKQAYLDCESRALTQQINSGEVAQCSVIYEELKLRSFDGDWKLLWKWTQRNLKQGQVI